jgi:hypothetical protein
MVAAPVQTLSDKLDELARRGPAQFYCVELLVDLMLARIHDDAAAGAR